VEEIIGTYTPVEPEIKEFTVSLSGIVSCISTFDVASPIDIITPSSY
jgi:hypothetical protein